MPSTGPHVIWYGAEVEAMIRAKEVEVLTLAAMDMRDYIKDRISVPHPSVMSARLTYMKYGRAGMLVHRTKRAVAIITTNTRLHATKQLVTGRIGIDSAINIGNSRYPFARTFNLHDNIQYEVDAFGGGFMGNGPVARVGTNVIYGKYLELGFNYFRTGLIIRRPWLTLGFNERAAFTAKILGAFAL